MTQTTEIQDSTDEPNEDSSRSLGEPFNRLFYAFIATKLADGLIAAAGPLLAATLTRDPVIISMMGATYMLPWLLFAIPIGTLVDRLDRRRTLATVNLIRASIAGLLSLALFFGVLNITLFYISIFIVGICDVFSDTVTQALVPTLVEHRKLEKANSRISGADTILIGFVGAPLGGVIFAISAVVPWVVETFGFIAASLLIAAIPASLIAAKQAKGERESFVAEMKSGISYLYRHKQLLRLVITTSILGLLFNVANATQVLYALDTLKIPQAFYGAVMTGGAVGALVGAWLAPRVSARWGRGTGLALGITTTTIFELLQGLAPNPAWYMIAMFFGGLGVAAWNILLMSLYHTLIPNEIFGRIHGTRRTLVWGLMPIGAVIGGVIAKVDLRLPYIVAGSLAILVAISAFKFIRQLGNTAHQPEAM